MDFFKTKTHKARCLQHFLFLLALPLLLEVSGQTNEPNASNETRSFARLSFDPHDITIEQHVRGSFNMILSPVLNDSVTYNLTLDDDGIILLPSQNTTLNAKGNLTFLAIGAGRTVVSAQSPADPYSHVNIKDAYVVVNVIHSQTITVVSDVVGWIYFASWIIASYPQVIENYQRKSVVGLDFNYLALNLLGHSSYCIFNIGLFFIPTIKTEYKEIYPRGVIPVRINDVCFSMHAALITAFTIFQCFIYERGSQTVSYTCTGLLVAMILFLMISLILAIVSVISWLDYLYYFSYIKLAVTVMKNCPQIYYNYKRKSTSGFSIWSVLIDFGGGFLSLVQMFLLAYNYNDWRSIFGDLSKFALGLLSVIIDVIYTFQHYVLYREPYSKKRASLILPRTESDSKMKSGSFII